MLRLMLQKIWHKKWMVSCLLLGCILLIATVVSFPLYRGAAFDRMVRDEFQDALAQNGVWPGMNRMTMIAKKDQNGAMTAKMESVFKTLSQELGVTEKESIMHYVLDSAQFTSAMNRQDMGQRYISLSFYSGLPEHVKMLSGEMYSETGLTEDGEIEVVVSQESMVKNNLLVGESLKYPHLKDAEGNPICMKVVGVFAEKNRNDFYWQVKPAQMNQELLMNEQLFRQFFGGENAGKYSVTCYYFSLFEHQDLTAESAAVLERQTRWLTEESSVRNVLAKPEYTEILDSYMRKKDRIEAALFILQVPVLILLGAFLFMISGQMYDMERNEISVMKSRGGSSGQMFRLYLFQSVFLTFLGSLLGIPLGVLFCRILGSTRNFLEFDVRRSLEVTFRTEVWVYAAVAILISIDIMTIPALKHSRLTIVKLKQSNAVKKRALWEKLFLDVICLAVSLYGYYSYSRNKEAIIQNVLEGESMDPLLYLSSSLFIVGMGLLFLRLQPLLVRLIFLAGKRFWKPASYASFMENIKSGRKQQFIMLFMILTVSLGMYHATVARTILQNAVKNADYLEPVDIIMQEIWQDNSADLSKSGAELKYIEPKFVRYSSMPGVKSYTKVLNDENASLRLTGKASMGCTLMGIHTREFGEMTRVPNYLTEKNYYEYLNLLAENPKGVLVSKNMKDTYGCEVGDTITYNDSFGNSTTGKILDFVEYWPGYRANTLQLKPDGTMENRENLLVVANIAAVQSEFGIYPYEVWADLKDDADVSAVYDWIEKEGFRVKKFRDKAAVMDGVYNDPLLQGTNGVLTMGFIVTIILCAVGYLIYWIMSIRSREMLFGVLRACGMHKGEVFQMLTIEQFFSGVLSILVGIGIGGLTSKMFVPMLQNAYAAANQILPMQLITDPVDMYRLFGVIAGVMVLCLFTLILLVFKMNVSKALKLGEE